MVQNFYLKLEKLLKKDSRFVDREGDLLKSNIIDSAYKADKKLIELLLSEKELKDKFFSKIKDVLVFNINDFVDYIQDKNFLADSYTKYRNKIGFNIDGKFLNEREETALVWPFKDCVLEGGMTKEDEKRKEIFFNEILAQDEIDKLLSPKVLTNWKKYTQNGKEKVKELKRDENDVIRENLIIKGNNLLALHSLKQQFQNKIKLIYIDPPYNTGNDSFGYNDNFNHSSWLTFMKNRLEVAKELLREDGVIFVQCDDNEQAYLKVLMDEVFRREDFVGSVISRSTPNARDYGAIAKMHEYIHIYSKSINSLVMYKITDKNREFSYKDNIGKFNIHPLYNSNVNFHKENRRNLYYPFYLNPNKKIDNDFFEISLSKEKDFIEIYPPKSKKDNVQFVWRWGKGKAIDELNINIVGYQNGDGVFRIMQKMRTDEQLPRSIWEAKEFSNRRGTEDLQKLFGTKKFGYPKSEYLLKRILEISTKENDIVLDFFAGSGTTGAVAHKMNRQYILIEQMDYIHELPEARLKKVIGKKVKKSGKIFNEIEFDEGGISKAVNWKGGGDFVYCELMQYNEQFVNKIKKAKNIKDLLKIWKEMKEKSFLNYNVDIKKIDETINEFKKLPFTKQQHILFNLLNKNQLYVNLSEIKDKEFKVGEEDKKMNNEFYKN